MVMEFIRLPMGLFMKVILNLAKVMAKESYIVLMDLRIKETLLRIRRMDMESSNLRINQFIKVSF
jgi:hypothetical protein